MNMEVEMEDYWLKEVEVERKFFGQMVKNRMIKMVYFLKIKQEILIKIRMIRRFFL